jgi:HEAT repeat protein
MLTTLSPYRLGKAREWFNTFNVFNAFSWSFLAGNIITLFAMRLNASSIYIGILSALLYVSYFFLPLGKLLTRYFSIVKIFSVAWIARSLGMTSLLVVPYLAFQENLALDIMFLGVFCFHLIRGIGLISNNPVLSYLAEGPDRDSYMTKIQIINSAVQMLCGLIIAVMLGRNPPLFLYSIIMAVGIITGIISGFLLQKIPELPKDEQARPIQVFDIIREALSKEALRLFIIIFFFVAMASGVSRTFIVVYAREVFGNSDGLISLYSVFGGLGYLAIGLLIRFLVERIGAKPIFIGCVIIGLLGILLVIFSPLSMPERILIPVLSFIFFILSFGFLGAEGIAQTYFLSLVPPALMLDMGIVYFMVFGVAGATGSFLAGFFLDMLTGFSVSPFMAYKVLFLILCLMTGFALFLQRRLVPMGALPFRGALGVIFSFRDLRAIALLERLDKTKDSHEEEILLGALHDTPSKLAIRELLERAKSPRLATRHESLRALETLHELNKDAEQALIMDILNHPFTTAYISARILGNQRVEDTIPLLREMASSSDYMLAGESIIALAKLGDEAFRPEIENLIAGTKNPRLQIMGVEAFGIYRSPHSITVLLDLLRVDDPPPYLRDAVVLALASILGVENEFYPLLVRFLEDEQIAPALAMDEAEAAYEYYRSCEGGWFQRRKSCFAESKHLVKDLQGAVSAFIQSGNESGNGAPLSRWILDLPDELCDPIVQSVLSEALLDDEFSSFMRLRLLIVLWSAYKLRELGNA